MRRTLAIIIALFAVTTAPALADGPYKLDTNGKCHDASGKFAKQARCGAPPTHCRDIKTKKFAKCSAPGTEPVPMKPA